MTAHDKQLASDVAKLVSEMQRLMWNPEARRMINEAGLHLTRAHFYSSIPSWNEIATSFEYVESAPPYADSSILDDEAMTAFLRALMPHAAEFSPPTQGDRQAPSGFFWQNSAFSFSDAMAYWCMLRHARPDTILEVGSGFSTLVALAAVRANGHGRIVCVEPFPRDFLRDADVELLTRPAQELDLAFFERTLTPGSVLFIDSTHTVKTGSDCLHLYLRILPRLRQHLYIHAHDIFLPGGYPKTWLLEHDIHWTEQYLLLALLEGNPSFRVLFGSNYHKLRNPTMLDEFMGGKAPSGGGSFWFERLQA